MELLLHSMAAALIVVIVMLSLGMLMGYIFHDLVEVSNSRKDGSDDSAERR